MMYFDHSATTPLNPKVMSLMTSKQSELYGNPSSIHFHGQKARALLEIARKKIATSINAKKEQIIFTSGGTESNNQVLWSQLINKKNHIISTTIEHPAVIKALQVLKPFGLEYSLVNTSIDGFVNINEIRKLITNKTGLISIMLANNEIGTIQPIKEISKLAHQNDILLHTDAVQCMGKMKIDVVDLGVDFLSLSAHKFYGPKGVGILYAKNPKCLNPMIIGGNQENGLRGGTENLISILGMALAAELMDKDLDSHIEHLKKLETQFKTGLNDISKDIVFNGGQLNKLPGLISVSFSGHKSSKIMIKLDQAEMYVSNGSACGSGNVDPSPVLKALGFDISRNISTIRFSFGMSNSLKDVQSLINELKKIL